MIKVVGMQSKAGGVINTTSRDHFWGRSLSPFFLKVEINFQGIDLEANVENAWQYSKVYDPPPDNEWEPHYCTKNFWPTQRWFNWAYRGMIQTRAERYPAGKGRKPLFTFWKGQKLKYLDARKEVYMPLYARAVSQTEAFVTLKNLYQINKKLTFQDFDAYDHRRLGMDWNDVIHCEERKMGHAFVLAMLLEGYIDNEGKVI